jgi:hypothetical protein
VETARLPLFRKAKEEQGSQVTFVFAVNQQPHCWQDLGVIVRGGQRRRVVPDLRGRWGRSGSRGSGKSLSISARSRIARTDRA